MLTSNTRIEECGHRSLDEDRQEFVEEPQSRNRGSRGALAGVLLGAGLWAVILVAVGVIRL